MGRREPGLIKPALKLTAGNIFNRLLGLVHRILLTRWLGAQGLGLLQLAFAAYAAVLAPFVSGLPPGLARAAALFKDPGSPQARRLITGLAAVALLLTALAAGVMLSLWPLLQNEAWLQVKQHLNLSIFAPIMMLAVLSALLRGLFLGLQQVNPIVSAQAAEQTARSAILAAALAVSFQLHWGLTQRLTLVLWNLMLGEVVSLAVLVWWYRQTLAQLWVVAPSPATPEQNNYGLGGVAKVAVPVALQRTVLAGARLLEASWLPVMLTTGGGIDLGHALAVYGEYSGMVLPLIQLPMVFIYALTSVLLPAAAQAQRRPGAVARQVGKAWHLAAHLGVLTGVALFLVGDTAVSLLLGSGHQLQPHPLAGRLAPYMAAVPFFWYTDAIVTSVLRGMDRAGAPLAAAVAAAALRLGLLYWLTTRYQLSAAALPLAATGAAAAGWGINLLAGARLMQWSAKSFHALLPAFTAALLAAAAGRYVLSGVEGLFPGVTTTAPWVVVTKIALVGTAVCLVYGLLLAAWQIVRQQIRPRG